MKKLALETILNESRWVAKMTYGRHVGTYEELKSYGYLDSEELRDIDVTFRQPDHLQGFFDDMWEYEKDHEWMTIQEFYKVWVDMPEKIRVIVKEPDKAAEIRRIENTLEAMQEIVDGYIEAVTITPDCIIICNEEGRINGMPYNCVLASNAWYGTVIIVGSDEEEFADVPQYIVDTFGPNWTGNDVMDECRVVVTQENWAAMLDWFCNRFGSCNDCPFQYDHCGDLEYSVRGAETIENFYNDVNYLEDRDMDREIEREYMEDELEKTAVYDDLVFFHEAERHKSDEPKLTCPVCGREFRRSEMDFTYDCHGIPFRLVCYDCLEALMTEKGYDGEYYTSADENIW